MLQTKYCPVCGKPFTKNSTAIYCSTACQQKAKRNRLKSHLDAEIELKFNDGGEILETKTQKNEMNKENLLALFTSWDREYCKMFSEKERNELKKRNLTENEISKLSDERGTRVLAFMEYADFIKARIANY